MRNIGLKIRIPSSYFLLSLFLHENKIHQNFKQVCVHVLTVISFLNFFFVSFCLFIYLLLHIQASFLESLIKQVAIKSAKKIKTFLIFDYKYFVFSQINLSLF